MSDVLAMPAPCPCQDECLSVILASPQLRAALDAEFAALAAELDTAVNVELAGAGGAG